MGTGRTAGTGAKVRCGVRGALEIGLGVGLGVGSSVGLCVGELVRRSRTLKSLRVTRPGFSPSAKSSEPSRAENAVDA